MKIVITGGAGYIGSHTIVELLKHTKLEIISIDNFSNSSAKTFERIETITGVKVKNYNVNISDFKELTKVFVDNPDITGVIHFAALKAVGDSVKEPLHYYDNNLNGLINVLQLCDQNSINNFIFSSSCTVYGEFAESPVSELTPLGQTSSPYGFTKKVGESIIGDYCKANPGFNCIPLRYFNPVGAHPTGLLGEVPLGKPSNLVPMITQTAAGLHKQVQIFGSDYETRDGTCLRDYVHVSDIAEAHVQALNYLLKSKNQKNFEIYNLGTGIGVTVLEVIQAFEKVSQIKLNYRMAGRREGDIPAIYADNSLAKRVLDWVPRYSIEDSMESAWKWQRNITPVSDYDTLRRVV